MGKDKKVFFQMQLFKKHIVLKNCYEEYVLKWGNIHSVLLNVFKKITKQCA